MTFQDGFQQRKNSCVKGYECLLIYEFTDFRNVFKTVQTYTCHLCDCSAPYNSIFSVRKHILIPNAYVCVLAPDIRAAWAHK